MTNISLMGDLESGSADYWPLIHLLLFVLDWAKFSFFFKLIVHGMLEFLIILSTSMIIKDENTDLHVVHIK